MSRSYKKVPYCGDKKGKDKKRVANRHVRRQLNRHPDMNVNYGKYKKLYEQYDICDYYWFCTWEEYWESELRSYEYFKNKKIYIFTTKKNNFTVIFNWLCHLLQLQQHSHHFVNYYYQITTSLNDNYRQLIFLL